MYNVGRSVYGTQPYGTLPYGAQITSLPVAQHEHDKAIAMTETISQSVGGRPAGESLLTVQATGDLVSKLCPDAKSALECLGDRAYNACYLENNGASCKEMNMLLGTALEVAAQQYLKMTRKSAIDEYFARPTRQTSPQVVSAETAALLIAKRTATR